MTFPAVPTRPLAQPGLLVWQQWASRVDDPQSDLLTLAELTDERAALRLRVVRDADAHDRHALRQLDAIIADLHDNVRRSAAWRTYAQEGTTT